jgi:hypothetical protein
MAATATHGPTIHDIQKQLKEFNTFAQTTHSPAAYRAKWRDLFGLPMSSGSANSFAAYYRDMRSNTRKNRRTRIQPPRPRTRMMQRGGAAAIQSAPLDYTMVPGLNIQAYGRFPIEAGTDPASIRDFDVYFRDSLTADCGVKDSSLQVPAGMGSNQVGGGRRRRRTQRRRRGGVGGRRRATAYRQRGGDLLESITARSPIVYTASAAPNVAQLGAQAWAGSTQTAPADPSIHTWELRTHGMGGAINPGMVAHVPSDVGRLANPAPWMSSQ